MQVKITDLLELVDETARRVIYSTLVTHRVDGGISARVMQHFQPDDDLAIWFGTNPNSRKVAELRVNPQATVIFHDDSETAYVTVSGTVDIIDNLDTRRSMWMEEWRAFFPDGAEGSDYVLLRLAPERVEILNFKREIAPPPYGLNHINLVRQDDGWALLDA
ncbi:MAG: pyridoxamine 5'-phosphate oxidase family protein [Chloroflexota bacterium]